LKNQKIKFLFWVISFFFFESVKQPKNRTICLLYVHKNIFLPVSFFVWRYLF
jgi:hypothetical protein